jgi:tetratricopeptide (TPR) repeat protein
MSDNYQEETQLLFRLLRAETFRFIIIRYNHYSIVNKLEDDIKRIFPDRQLAKINAKENNFDTISEQFFALDKGFFFIDNFDKVIKEETNSAGIETPEMVIENQRRRSITAGINLRRDAFAKKPIALIVLIPATTIELYAKTIMEKMPDMWSFRSMLLDLSIEIPTLENASNKIESNEKIINQPGKISKELQRLLDLAEKIPPTETALLATIYPQIVKEAKRKYLYDIELATLYKWEAIAQEKEKGEIWIIIGDNLIIRGKLNEAIFYFERAQKQFIKEKNNFGLSYALERLGESEMNLGNLSQAITHFEEDLKLSKKLVADFPMQRRYKNGLAISYSKLGDTQIAVGNLPQALIYFQERNKLAKELVAENPMNVEYKNGLAISFERLGNTQKELGNLSLALNYYEERNKLAKELLTDNPMHVGYKNGLAISYEKLGDTQKTLGNLSQALRYFEEDLKLSKELVTENHMHIDYKNGLAISFEKLGGIHKALGNLSEALTYFEERNKLAKDLVDDYPNHVDYKNGLAISFEKLGDTQLALGNLSQALTYFEEQSKLEKELVAENPIHVGYKNGLAISYSKLGDVQKDLGNLSQALTYFEERNKLAKELVADNPMHVGYNNGLAISYSKLGHLYHFDMIDNEKALNYYNQCKIIWEEMTKNFPDFPDYKRNLEWVNKHIKELQK